MTSAASGVIYGSKLHREASAKLKASPAGQVCWLCNRFIDTSLPKSLSDLDGYWTADHSPPLATWLPDHPSKEDLRRAAREIKPAHKWCNDQGQTRMQAILGGQIPKGTRLPDYLIEDLGIEGLGLGKTRGGRDTRDTRTPGDPGVQVMGSPVNLNLGIGGEQKPRAGKIWDPLPQRPFGVDLHRAILQVQNTPEGWLCFRCKGSIPKREPYDMGRPGTIDTDWSHDYEPPIAGRPTMKQLDTLVAVHRGCNRSLPLQGVPMIANPYHEVPWNSEDEDPPSRDW